MCFPVPGMAWAGDGDGEGARIAVVVPEAEGVELWEPVLWGFQVVLDPGPGSSDNFHRIGGCIGYTYNHLPVKSCSPPLPKKEEASRAIFAARMAFSSLVTLLRLI